MTEPSAPPPIGREYTRDILDRMTGEVLTISLGQWVTVTELGQFYGVGPRRVRTILRELDFVYPPGGNPKQAHRITPWAVAAGLGRRHDRGRNIKHAFDVISPAGQQWIAERWAGALAAVDGRLRGDGVSDARERLAMFKTTRPGVHMGAREEVCWLADHIAGLSQEQMALALDITQQLVSRFLADRSRQIARGRSLKNATLPEVSRSVAPSASGLATLWLGEINNASPQHPEKSQGQSSAAHGAERGRMTEVLARDGASTFT